MAKNKKKSRKPSTASPSAAAWTRADHYKVIIGGIRFTDVRYPVAVDGKEFLRFERHRSGGLAVSFDIHDASLNRVAIVARNQITAFDEAKYLLRNSTNRSSLVERETGKVLCEICIPAFDESYEMDLSFLTHAKPDYPILMHPNRTKIGPVPLDRSPQLSFLTLTTEFGTGSAAVTIDHGSFYLLDVALENFAVGFRVLTNGPDGMSIQSGLLVK